MKSEIRYIDSPSGKMKIIILRFRKNNEKVPGILWIHGGGYIVGMAEMVYFSRGRTLAKKYGGVVVSPGYRLAGKAPYPAALEDCCAALTYMLNSADELGIDKIVVGGESAGGGLAAALCIYARDHGISGISLQLPLYPMIDCADTDSSRDNHGRIWNTKRNHYGWSRYLGELYGTDAVPKYASAARETDFRGLPPCYTFVSDGEPFYSETLSYVEKLRTAGVEAYADVYHGNVHAFDMLAPWKKESRAAKRRLIDMYGKMI